MNPPPSEPSAPDELAEMKQHKGRLRSRDGWWDEAEQVYVRASDADRVIAAMDARIAKLESQLASALWFVPGDVLCGELQQKQREYASRDAEIGRLRTTNKSTHRPQGHRFQDHEMLWNERCVECGAQDSEMEFTPCGVKSAALTPPTDVGAEKGGGA